MQLAALAQDTADSPALCAPGTACRDNTLQLLPSHSSAAGLGFGPVSGPLFPTAMHSAGAGQEIPVKVACPGATASVVHARPSQDSANELVDGPVLALPMAMHRVRLAQDTADRPRA